MTKNLTNERVEYVYQKSWYYIEIKNELIHFNCVKKTNTTDLSIHLLNVISVSCQADEWEVNEEGKPLLETSSKFVLAKTASCFSLTINFWLKSKKHQRQFNAITLRTFKEKDCMSCKEWVELELEENLTKHGCLRPKRLLVIVNPYSGKKKGKFIYDKTVTPLFRVAGIKETLVYTEYFNHAREITESCDLSKYDGIVVVGGDGTFSEAANGALINEHRKLNLPLDGEGKVHSKPMDFAKPKIRFGVIPAGSANCTAWSSQGIEDPETATLQIICGESHPLDVCSVHDAKEKFLQFSLSCSFYGFLTKVVYSAENIRFLGPIRYDFSILYTFLKHQTYSCEVTYFKSLHENPVNLRTETSRCRFPCSSCLGEDLDNSKASTSSTKEKPLSPRHAASKQEDIENEAVCDRLADSQHSSDQKDFISKVIRGTFHMVNSFSLSFMYDKSPEGLAPSAHLSDGTLDLVLLHSTTRGGLMRYMKSLRGSENSLDFPFTEAHRIRGYRLRALTKNELEDLQQETQSTEDKPKPSQMNTCATNEQTANATKDIWSIDGEFNYTKDFTMWVHKGLINIFSKGIERE